jgi:protein TonB
MLLYGLRFLVALLTFAVGVAASSLLSSKRAVTFERRVVVSAPILVEAPADAMSPHEPTHCPSRLPIVVSGGTLNGKAISKPAPLYPADARAANVHGTVVVQVVIDEGGGVREAEAIGGPSLLRAAAVDAARLAKFSPTRLSGQPVRVSGTITYNFMLE